MVTQLWIALGSALGGMARFLVASLITTLLGPTFPWGTLVVNITGSLIIGFAATATGPEGRFLVSNDFRTFILVGICGGYTTFSSFSLQTVMLMRDGEWLRAGENIVLSILLCLLATWLGHVLALGMDHFRGA